MRKYTAIFLLLVLASPKVSGERQSDAISEKGDYVFGWELSEDGTDIIFDVSVQTKGWVGFGLNTKANMVQADIFVGGVNDDGTPYSGDYYSTGPWNLDRDATQNWVLLEACENATHTTLKFTRPVVSCDTEKDFSITDDTVNVIWAYGETDEVGYHDFDRGGKQYYLLDPPQHEDISNFKIWEVRVNNTMPAKDTSYVCSFHKLEKYDKPHHLVGMEVYLGDDVARRHTHHFIVTVCNGGVDLEYLEELSQTTHDCETIEMTNLRAKCNDVMFGWAVGGRRTLLPEHLDMPVGDGTQNDQYVRFEVHYDNPESTPGLQFTAGFNVFFSDEPREQQGGIMIVGKKELDPGLLIPPGSQSFKYISHCSPDITREYLPEDGIKAAFTLLHGHVAARKMKLRHFRGNEELPWILVDDNYDFDYQQQRQLKNEVHIMPGDQLTVECDFETTDRPGVVTLSGEKTQDEMCHAYLMYYPKLDLKGCVSIIPIENFFEPFGIKRVLEMPFDPVITWPISMLGKRMSQVMNAADWTPELAEQMQQMQLNVTQRGQYYLPGQYDFLGEVKFPDISEPWTPPVLQCKPESDVKPGDGDEICSVQETGNPGDTTTPENPGESTTPENPGETTTPENPGDSTTPENPGDTTTPDIPNDSTTGNPGDSTTPDIPNDSTTGNPGDSTTPDIPAETTTPGNPGEITTPGNPSETTTPDNATPEGTTQSASPESTTNNGGNNITGVNSIIVLLSILVSVFQR